MLYERSIFTLSLSETVDCFLTGQTTKTYFAVLPPTSIHGHWWIC
jgi:hypothetical protein